MFSLTEIVRYADDYLRIAEIDDWPNALNGLQIENSGAVTKIGATVDASTATLRAAAMREINFLIVHTWSVRSEAIAGVWFFSASFLRESSCITGRSTVRLGAPFAKGTPSINDAYA